MPQSTLTNDISQMREVENHAPNIHLGDGERPEKGREKAKKGQKKAAFLTDKLSEKYRAASGNIKK